MKFTIAVYILSLGFLLSSCNTNTGCSEKTDVNLKVAFFKRTLNPNTGLYSIAPRTIDSIWVRGSEKDSFLYKNSKLKNSLLLPLSNSVTESKFIIQFNDKTDTLVFYHKNNDQYFLSLECGFIVTHNIDVAASTYNFIDSISIINPVVNNFDAVHVQIFN